LLTSKEIAMGRPPLPKAHKRAHKLHIMLTESEIEQVRKATIRGGFATMSDYIRSAVKAAVETETKIASED
jgi:Arc/MetJ-type ribon-helix-helix transcriptional regulator